MDALNRAIDRVIVFLAFLCGVVVAAITLLVSSDVVMRYLFNSPIEDVFEITEHSLVFMTFLAAPWVLMKDQHVRMEGVLNLLSPANRAMLFALTSSLGAVICLILFWYGFKGTWDYFQRGLTFPEGRRIPQYPILSVIVLAYLLMLVQFIRNSARWFKEWRALKTGSHKSAKAFEGRD